ncbi:MULTISPECIES: HAD-IA family hydrolase [Pacificibacter]|uniref:HAD-IA family hydrolase n=1 Tax=Pacificibacter TaxID=1042323 RepID=UPI001C0973CE|nr:MULTISPECIES: HAD-IA family hydrolase [Pacificibacter]MBU2935112.1 HAD-IA family hydrolase [Pacificibacter marinus]MDO6615902.1 HAD-IA family hydrolase [Pacificibacter sp. 1_MG-2023]
MTKLVIFDVDGTLVDSQAHIIASMTAAFGAAQIAVPSRNAILSIVGLSLPYAIRELAPDASEATIVQLVEDYKTDFNANRIKPQSTFPLFDGASEAIERLSMRADVQLAIATGNSRRGLNGLLEMWPFAHHFVSTQCADDHPSKPHPSMVQSCLADCDVNAQDAIVIGDTTYDMEMARAARCSAIGVSWGYHGAGALKDTGASIVIDDFAALDDALDEIWKD